MDNCASEVIQKLLVDLGIGVLRSVVPEGPWCVYATQMADTPDEAICVHATESQMDGRQMVDGRQIEHNGFQIEVRASTYELGFAKMEEVRLALDQSILDNEVTVGGNIYSVHSVSRKGGVNSLGRDTGSGDRQRFTVNGIVSMKQTA